MRTTRSSRGCSCRRCAPGDLVVMDDLLGHNGPRVRQMNEAAAAAAVYLPPYSPDLNPIEPVFAKVKQALRSAARRTAHALWSSMQGTLDRVTASEADSYLRRCGYTAQVNRNRYIGVDTSF